MGDYLLVDNFVGVRAGDSIRLLPYGAIYKNGKRRVITPEVARSFKLPNWKPPIKLGSHDDAAPAGGFIVGLEARDDGLYALTEFTDKGAKAIEEGDYRYHSPEILWEGGGLENAQTGEIEPGPYIVGDALLHTPHLGEAAALYHYEEVSNMETVEVPKSMWEKFTAWVDRALATPQPDPEPEPAPAAPADPEPDKFAALAQERDDLAAKLAAIQAEAERKAKIDAFGAKLAETKAAQDGAELLAGMTAEQSEWVLTQFAALSAQIDASLTGEVGSGAQGDASDNPKETIHRRTLALMAEKQIDYNAALDVVRAEAPDLFAAAYGKH